MPAAPAENASSKSSTCPPQYSSATTTPPTRILSWGTLKRLSPIAFFGLVASISGIFGPVWPTTPMFSPGVPSFAHPLDIPFTVTNNSFIFDVYALKIECLIIDVRVSDKRGAIARLDGNTVKFPAVHKLGAGEKRSYTCPFQPTMGTLLAEMWGSPDNKVLKAIIQFNIEYRIFFLVFMDLSASSSVFYLDTKTNPPQWTYGAPMH